MVWLPGGLEPSSRTEEEAEQPAQQGVARPPMPCPKCNQRMHEGFALDSTSTGSSGPYYQVGAWLDGPLEYGWLGGLKLRRGKVFQIAGYRCPACGYLELYSK